LDVENLSIYACEEMKAKFYLQHRKSHLLFI